MPRRIATALAWRAGQGREMTAAHVRAWLEAGLPWGILGLMGAGILGGRTSEGIERLVQQNGAVLLLVALVVQYAPRAIDAQRGQAAAMTDLASAVRDLTAKDDYQRREMLGLLQVLAEDMRDVKRELRGPTAARTERFDGERRGS